jgi:hypothetical protein
MPDANAPVFSTGAPVNSMSAEERAGERAEERAEERGRDNFQRMMHAFFHRTALMNVLAHCAQPG